MENVWVVVVSEPLATDCGSHSLRMAEAFWSLGCKVLYIESSGDRRVLRRIAGQRERRKQKVYADLERRGFFLMRASQLPWLPIWFPLFVRRWNCAQTSRRAEDFLTDSGAEKVIVCNHNWMMRGFLGKPRDNVVQVYECADDHRSAPHTGPILEKQIVRNENKLVARADLIVFSSAELARERGDTEKSFAILPVGVAPEHFNRPLARDPHERLAIPVRSPSAPRIGFVGSLTERADWLTVVAAAEMTPDWQWVIAGPARGVAPRRGPKNIHWLGRVRYSDVPIWMQHWDVGLVPHSPETKYNQLTSPLKLLEYLAAGLPVVSTDISAGRELARKLPGQVFVCQQQTPECLIETLRRALAVPVWRAEAGRAYARQHSWQNRARQLLAMLDITCS